MTHTKGPWRAELTADERHGEIWAENGQKITVLDCRYGEIGEPEANARLIAAAPELLEALDALLWAAAEKTLKQKEEVWEQARRAIAKANGE